MPPTERPSHFLPRTREGRIATVSFVALFLLALPPVSHTLFNRIEPSAFGMPFLYLALGAVYAALLGVLIWAYRRDV